MYKAIDEIGEFWFRTSDHALGHGDPETSALWSKYGIDEAPDGFVFIVDAECIPVALVPQHLSGAFVRLLNGRE